LTNAQNQDQGKEPYMTQNFGDIRPFWFFLGSLFLWYCDAIWQNQSLDTSTLTPFCRCGQGWPGSSVTLQNVTSRSHHNDQSICPWYHFAGVGSGHVMIGHESWCDSHKKSPWWSFGHPWVWSHPKSAKRCYGQSVWCPMTVFPSSHVLKLYFGHFDPFYIGWLIAAGCTALPIPKSWWNDATSLPN